MKGLFQWAVDNQHGSVFQNNTFREKVSRFLLRWVFAERYRYYVMAHATESFRMRIRSLEGENTMYSRRLDSMYKICAEMDGTGKSFTYESLMNQVHGKPSSSAQGGPL